MTDQTPATEAHEHDPNTCHDCRRHADMFFAGGVRAENKRIEMEVLKGLRATVTRSAILAIIAEGRARD